MEDGRSHQNNRKIGAWGETIACEYLKQQGFEIVDRNVYTDYGEIDIVARFSDRFHIIEVKTHRSDNFGYPEEAITDKKRQHMYESAEAYLQTQPDPVSDYQTDVIAIRVGPDGQTSEITYFENAI